jgi:hypothetical protein
MVAFIIVSVLHCALLSHPPPIFGPALYNPFAPPTPSSSSSPHPPTPAADHRPSAQSAQRSRSNGIRARPLYVRTAAARPLGPTARTNPPPRCHPRRSRAARPQSTQGGMKQWHPRAAARAPTDERRDACQQAKLVLKSRSTSQCDRARGGRAELYYWFGWRGRASARLPAATTRQQLKLVPQSHGVVVVAAQAARPRGARRSCWYGMRRGGRAQTTARAAGGAVGVSAHARGAWLRGAAPGTGARGRRCARRRLRPRALFAPPPPSWQF